MPESLPDVTAKPTPLETVALWLALAYLCLLTIPIPFTERIYLHDALLPVMGVIVLLRRKSLTHYLASYRYLMLFLSVAAIVTAFHAALALRDAYEWVVFAYQAVLFVFFAETRFTDRLCRLLATALFTACLLAFLYELTPLPTRFSFISEKMADTAMGFLARRFTFTMNNPNLFGVYYAIPVALATRLTVTRDWSAASLRQKLIPLAFLPVILLPILSSASKHGIITVALLSAWIPALFPTARKLLQTAAFCAVFGLAILFETTVLFTTFPLTPQPPCIDVSPGMYSLHQGAYLRMMTARPARLILGIGATRAKQLYPDFCDRIQIADTLKRYNSMDSYEAFTSFMDPHQEYLNLITLFGLPAAAILCAFWITLPRQATPDMKATAALFVMAVLAAALWDDLFSKRYLWIAAAILVPTISSTEQHETHLPR